MIMLDLNLLEKVEALVRDGYQPVNISEIFGLSMDEARQVYELALGRIRYRDKFETPFVVDIESGRLSTHEIVAEYHAKRLKTERIADLGCGAGIQLVSFARHSDLAVGIELDKNRAEIAKLNLHIAGVENAKVLVGDIFSNEIKSELNDFDILFSDPARPYNEKVRTLDSCQPNPEKIIKFYESIGASFAFDIPPQIRRGRVNLSDAQEFEYISLDGHLNRLTLYLGDLAKTQRSVVVLPGEHRLEYDENIDREPGIVHYPGKYLFDVDSAVIAADLLPELYELTNTPIVHKDKRRVIMTSDEEVSSPFFRSRYILLATGSFRDILDAMKRENMGKVIFRFGMDPRKYYEKKGEIEKELKGNRTGFIFKFDSRFFLAMKL